MVKGPQQDSQSMGDVMHVWFGDDADRELEPHQMYLAVYAAGGGKRNMANFVQDALFDGSFEPRFRPGDVLINVSDAGTTTRRTQLCICRYASNRGEWVLKPVPQWHGQSKLKLVPEWFKARFWDNKQEKKHPWFMFALLVESSDGSLLKFSSNPFPVHQYYPTGVKKTDPNDANCRTMFHRVLKQAPSTSLRRELLGSSISSLFYGGNMGRNSPNISDYDTSSTATTPDSRRSSISSMSGDIHKYKKRLTPPARSKSSNKMPMRQQQFQQQQQQQHHHHLPATSIRQQQQQVGPMVVPTFVARSWSPNSINHYEQHAHGTDGMQAMDCDNDEMQHQQQFMSPIHTMQSSQPYYDSYIVDVEPIKRYIGQKGVDAAHTLLTLQNGPMR
eukprot:m.173374 g.173374  ORF g.173374 m.173374 type:complete len:388 (+) comp15387_c0_seq1:427-1590(+)